MAKPYSNDLRQRVAAAIASGDSCRSIAEQYEIAPSTVVKWSKRVRETGSAAPAKFGGHRTCTLEPHRDFLLAQLEVVPHLTLHKLKDLLAARGIAVSHDTVWRFLRRQGRSFKKTAFASEQHRPDVARRRRRWRRASHHLDPERLVFIDETWIKTNMAPIRGWGIKGERLKGFAPDGRWRTLTFLAALRADALTAPCVVDGPINGSIFRAYVEQFLLPELRPGDIVVLDNLGSHRAQAIRHAILGAGAKLAFLPPYSPDFNPIEQVFAKAKHWLRMAQAPSIEAIHDHVAALVSASTQTECANYFRNAGYVSS
ncbi:MAG: IS630 family transposase [Rhodospirillales bacterium]|nr:IS630 family transposase [Rhodospirillales bacterium]